tara:strand:- start:28 stop:867 length:840 start_codon:yes stop_codon:yes gene_type:complete
MSQFKNKEILKNLSNQQNWNLVERFMDQFHIKVDSTFICDTVLIRDKDEYRCEFQIKDTKKKYIDFFGTHEKKYEFALSLGKKHFTFYIRLGIDRFKEKKELTFLTINSPNYKNQPKNKSKREGYISKIKSNEDIDELINFIFIECLGYFLEKSKTENIKSEKLLQQEFEKEIELSGLLTREERLKKSAKYNKIPKKIITKSFDYRRNPHVITEALDRANGVCEKCNKKGPFVRDKNNTLYLEVHHKTPLSEKGEDTLENVIALCPNCHRQAHYGKKTY